MRSPDQSLYGNHFAVPASDIYEGDYVFNRLVTDAEDYAHEIQFRLDDGSLIVASPSDIFPVQFPAFGPNAATEEEKREYREWTRADPIPKGVKLNGVSTVPVKRPTQHFKPRSGHRRTSKQGIYQNGAKKPRTEESAKNIADFVDHTMGGRLK